MAWIKSSQWRVDVMLEIGSWGESDAVVCVSIVISFCGILLGCFKKGNRERTRSWCVSAISNYPWTSDEAAQDDGWSAGLY